MQFVLGWTEPYLVWFLDCLNGLLRVNLQLYTHWKYIFVAMSLYLAADASARWGHGKKVSALFSIALGGTIALTSSVAAGTVPLKSSSVLLMVFPAIGVITHLLVQSAWDVTFGTATTSRIPTKYTRARVFAYHTIAFGFTNAVICGFLVIIALWASHLELPSLGLLLLLAFVILMALRNILVAAIVALLDRAEGEGWVHRFRSLPTQSHGLRILIVVVTAIGLTILQAGEPPPLTPW